MTHVTPTLIRLAQQGGVDQGLSSWTTAALSLSRGRGSISARWPSYSQGPDNARAMSWENLEIFRQLNAAWNAGDVDAVRDFHDPNVILRPIEG